MSILFYQSNAQTTWQERRDWVVGRYEGHDIDGDTTLGDWSPRTIEVKYHDMYNNLVRVSLGGCSLIVCEDGLLGQSESLLYNDTCIFNPPFTKTGGIFYPADSTLEYWWYCPPASCNENPCWIFFRGKKVESYANKVNTTDYFKNVNIYPNPVIDIINIEKDNFDVVLFEIYDLRGRLLFKENLKTKNKSINISFLNKGIYVYKLINKEDKIKFGKIIKQ